MQYRILSKDDLNQYKTFKLLSLKESPFAFSESYEDELMRDSEMFGKELIVEGNPPETFVLGAFSENNELVGIVRFMRDQRSKARHKSIIKTMYVHPEYRSNNIGKALILNLLERIEGIAGLEQIHLWVLHSKTNASKFYANCGFETQGTIVKKDLKVNNEYVDAEYMVKYL